MESHDLIRCLRLAASAYNVQAMQFMSAANDAIGMLPEGMKDKAREARETILGMLWSLSEQANTEANALDKGGAE